MEEELVFTHVMEKLSNKIPFGLFEDGKKCYFADGEQVHYKDLWTAIKKMPQTTDEIRGKTLNQLFPDIFEGSFPYKHSRHNWKKKATKKN